MGLAASQTRYLSLTARKSDLEFQSQTINTRRLQLAYKSAEAAKAYSEGMNNKIIKVANYTTGTTNGTTTKEWENLNYNNLVSHGYQVIGANGASLQPSPYTEYVQGSSINAMTYNLLPESQKSKCSTNGDGSYTLNSTIRLDSDPSYDGMDIQSLLVSGQGQIVTEPFFSYLCEHGYGSGRYIDDEGNETTYADLLDKWQANKNNCNSSNTASIVDWRSDTTSTFKQDYYTEDDAQVNADYEATTAEIQAQDKMLEMQIKNIETQHKAIETEMESVKKVIDKNIENSFKSFA